MENQDYELILNSMPETAALCAKDVHDTIREGLERENALLAVVGQSFSIYTIDLETGTVDSVREDGYAPKDPPAKLPQWDALMASHIKKRLHPAYQESFCTRFSLAGLREAKQAGEQERDLLCQWKAKDVYRYISVTAHLGQRQGENGHVVISLEDMDERVRRELVHSQHDMQIAAILKSRFSVMTTVHLENGQCERIYLNDSDELKNSLIGDYNYFFQQALLKYVHPEDTAEYCGILSLEHLRETASATESYLEETCQYRTQGTPTRWVEQQVIYSLQGGRMTVNILGHDITQEKSREDERLKAMQERAYIISSLSSLFFSTYYINLEQGTFRPVTQLGKVGDVLGNEVNCDVALRIYAEHFIHPDDREEYLAIMNTSNFTQSLRWWQPYVTATYRMLPEECAGGRCSYKWVRATAVLAQIGQDDIPLTAVYVAQDITETAQRKTQE